MPDHPFDAEHPEPDRLEFRPQLPLVVEDIVDRIAGESLALAVREAHSAVLRVEHKRGSWSEHAPDLGIEASSIIQLEVPDEFQGEGHIERAVAEWQDEPVTPQDPPVVLALLAQA